MKRGLKYVVLGRTKSGTLVKEDSPMKRGLKFAAPMPRLLPRLR